MMLKTAQLMMGLGLFGLQGCAMEAAQEMDAETIASLSEDSMSEDVSQKTALSSSCYTNNGMNPLKAALAVSMAKEMGRVDAVQDLYNGDRVYISWAGLSQCASRGQWGCPNTQAILDLQKPEVNYYLDQRSFSATTFKEELRASFERQKNHESNLSRNEPWKVPQAHTLTQKGTFTAQGACGVHYDFAAQGSNIKNIEQRLEFFGGRQNPFIAFQSTNNSIAIDPTGTMNGDTGSSSGSTILACTSTNSSLRDRSCSCDGKTGKLRVAPWNSKTLYCAT